MAGRAPLTRVIVLGGPSGSGKTRLAERLGLPVVPLDEFYKDGDDPTMPRIGGHLDWESPQSWKLDAAMTALEAICIDGTVEIPTYSYAENRATGSRTITLTRTSTVTSPPRTSAATSLAGTSAATSLPRTSAATSVAGTSAATRPTRTSAVTSRFVVTEGIFAAEVLAPLRSAGLLADAILIHNRRLTTFGRRLRRDLSDRRKPVRDILRIGVQKVRAEAAILRELERAGCTPMSSRAAESRLRTLIS